MPPDEEKHRVFKTVWASRAGEGSWRRLNLIQVLTEVGLLKRKEIFRSD